MRVNKGMCRIPDKSKTPLTGAHTMHAFAAHRTAVLVDGAPWEGVRFFAIALQYPTFAKQFATATFDVSATATTTSYTLPVPVIGGSPHKEAQADTPPVGLGTSPFSISPAAMAGSPSASKPLSRTVSMPAEGSRDDDV